MSHQSTTRGSLNIWDEGVRKYVVADPRLHESSSSLDDISLDPFTSSGRSTARESPQPELAYPYVDAMPRSMNRLRLPLLGDTCERLLKSALPFVDPYHYNALKDELHAFQQGAGKELQRLLEAREAQQDQPSWLEQFCDDMYLENRDPLPINVNYFFGFKPHPVPAAMTQVGRAASLLHAALEVYVQIRDGTLTNDMERASPLCMSQMRRVFCASRVPGEPRDSIVSYSTAPLTADERLSDTCQYVAVSPSHCVVIVRNRFYRVRVLDDGGAVLPLERIGSAIARAVASAQDPGPPVGLLTTLQRGEWAEAYKQLAELGNGDLLLSMQSAIMVVCLDSAEAKTPAELAKMLLHGTGMNRWFDRHNLIVARNGAAGINLEHSVGDAATALRVANAIVARDGERWFCACAMDHIDAHRTHVEEMVWNVGASSVGAVVQNMQLAASKFKAAIDLNAMEVLSFSAFGSAGIIDSAFKLCAGGQCKLSVDAFVQIALNLTYFRLYGSSCAIYEPASTRRYCHGRTEAVRSATTEARAFCESAVRPVIANAAFLFEELHSAIKAHVKLMEEGKSGQGTDRHLLGLRKIAEKFYIPLPEFMTDPNSALGTSSRWIISTAHCGSKYAPMFGFGPAVADGFGVGYMISEKEIRFTVTNRMTDTSRCCLSYLPCHIFCLALEQSLVLMRAILSTAASCGLREIQSLASTELQSGASAFIAVDVVVSQGTAVQPDGQPILPEEVDGEDGELEDTRNSDVERVCMFWDCTVSGPRTLVTTAVAFGPTQLPGVRPHMLWSRPVASQSAPAGVQRVLLFWDCDKIPPITLLGASSSLVVLNRLLHTIETWLRQNGFGTVVYVARAAAYLPRQEIEQPNQKSTMDKLESMFECFVSASPSQRILTAIKGELQHRELQHPDLPADRDAARMTHVVLVSGDLMLQQDVMKMRCNVHTVHNAPPQSEHEKKLFDSSSSIISVADLNSMNAVPTVVVNVSGRLIHLSLLVPSPAVAGLVADTTGSLVGSWCTRDDPHDLHACPSVHCSGAPHRGPKD